MNQLNPFIHRAVVAVPTYDPLIVKEVQEDDNKDKKRAAEDVSPSKAKKRLREAVDEDGDDDAKQPNNEEGKAAASPPQQQQPPSMNAAIASPNYVLPPNVPYPPGYYYHYPQNNNMVTMMPNNPSFLLQQQHMAMTRNSKNNNATPAAPMSYGVPPPMYFSAPPLPRHVTMMMQQQQQRRQGVRLLALHTDTEHLSEYQMMVRQQLELFEAGPEDVECNTQGRKRTVTVGQVGLRCRHCATLPLRSRGRGAVYYPAKLHGVYQAAQNMAGSHLCKGACPQLPVTIRNEVNRLRNLHDNASGGKQYWADGCRALGLTEVEGGGLCFVRTATANPPPADT